MALKVEVRGDPRRRRAAIKKSGEKAEKKRRQYLMKHRTVNISDTPRLRAGQVKSTAQTKASKDKAKTASRRKR